MKRMRSGEPGGEIPVAVFDPDPAAGPAASAVDVRCDSAGAVLHVDGAMHAPRPRTGS